MKFRPVYRATLLGLAWGFWRCAHMEAPPGGPVDTTLPRVVAVYPAPNAVNLSRDLNAQFEFSEWVNAHLEKNQVLLSPPLAKKIHVKALGNRLELTSEAQLEPKTTYSLSLNNIADLNGLRLKDNYQIIFSTGPEIDSGEITGWVGGLGIKGAPTNTLVAMYPNSSDRFSLGYLQMHHDSLVSPDTLPQIHKERPMYICATDSAGRFHLSGIKPGSYAVIAFQDLNQNQFPNLGSENLAIGNFHREVKKNKGDVLQLTLAAYDTASLKLQAAEWLSESVAEKKAQGIIRVKFNREPHPQESLLKSAYRLIAHNLKDTLNIVGVNRNPQTGEIELSTSGLVCDSEYVLRLQGMRDNYGNLADTSHWAKFRVSAKIDSTPIRFFFLGGANYLGMRAKLPSDNFFPNHPFSIYSSKTLTPTVLTSIKTNLSLKIDTVTHPFEIQPLNTHEFTVKYIFPEEKDETLNFGWKKLTKQMDSSTKMDIAPLESFKPIKSSQWGLLKLKLDKVLFGWTLLLTQNFGPTEIRKIIPREEMLIDSIPVGAYHLEYFQDKNGDGLWNAGTLLPWHEQEGYRRGIDTVQIKAREVSELEDLRKPSFQIPAIK